MKITQEVREYAMQKEVAEESALERGLKEKAQEFLSAGAELYQRSTRQD